MTSNSSSISAFFCSGLTYSCTYFDYAYILERSGRIHRIRRYLSRNGTFLSFNWIAFVNEWSLSHVSGLRVILVAFEVDRSRTGIGKSTGMLYGIFSGINISKGVAGRGADRRLSNDIHSDLEQHQQRHYRY